MKEVVINVCFGGFSLSYDAVMEYAKKKGITIYAFVDKGDKNSNLNLEKFKPYNPHSNRKVFLIHYSKKPLSGDTCDEEGYFSDRDIERDDPVLIEIIKEMGEKASGKLAKLKIVEIPDDIEWEVEEHDGNEWVSEKHRTWN